MSDHSKPLGKLASDDLELWQAVTKTIAPIKSQNLHVSAMVPDQPGLPPRPVQSKKAVKPSKPLVAKAPKYSPQAKKPPALTGFDRRTEQKLTRGNVQIDGRLDLHGMVQATAHDALLSFLTQSHQRHHRLVLVITGKGHSPFSQHTLHGRDHFFAPERQGILRTALAGWLIEDRFRQLVIGFQPAHPKHGGGGAYYVKLRRRAGEFRSS